MKLETFVIIALVTYRLTLLISKESGPFDIMGRFRSWVGVEYDQYSNPIPSGQISEMILCPYCLSVWVAIGVTIGWVVAHILKLDEYYLYVLLPFALSGFSVFFFKWAGV